MIRKEGDASQDDLAVVRGRIAEGASVAVLSGAGISAASGIPTFRGSAEGFWSRFRPEDLATPEAFASDPELVWRWYDWRREMIASSGPNAAHRCLALMESRCPVTVITQNVDGYHQRAGSRQVLEYHGSIWRLRCTACGQEDRDERVPLPLLPHCARCGGLLRPGVVWFGEAIDSEVMRDAQRAAVASDVFLVIGTAGVVYPAAGLVAVARSAGALVVELNLTPSAITPMVDVFFAGSAADTVPRLDPECVPPA